MASRPVTVVLSGFEDLVRLGLVALVAEDPHLELLRSEVAPDALHAVLAEHAPDVAVVNLGALASAADVRHLHAAHPDVRLVVLANRPSAADAHQLLALGAMACLGKEVQARDIRNAFHLASRGLQVLPRPAGDAAPALGPQLLTAREAEVLDLLRQGRSNGEIAAALCVGVETVRTHRRNVYRKLGVRTRSELAAHA
jgi:DNA-binding NarL/FixJ family response regulator